MWLFTVTAVETEKRMVHHAGDSPYGPFLPSTEEVTYYTITFDKPGSDRYLVWKHIPEEYVPERLRHIGAHLYIDFK